MSANVYGVFRTAKIIKPYSVDQRNGKNGTFESRMIMFSVATDREYRHAVTKEDGSVVQERQTDFYALRATGPIADTLAKYASAMRTDDNGNQKLVSRRMLIKGHLETYPATRKETISAVVNGQTVQLAVELPEERKIIVAESIEFLDANPTGNNSNANAGTAVTATVVGQPTPATPVVNATTATPATPVVGAVSAEEAPF